MVMQIRSHEPVPIGGIRVLDFGEEESFLGRIKMKSFVVLVDRFDNLYSKNHDSEPPGRVTVG